MSGSSERVYNVLFLCTGNSARSLLAEALLGRSGPPRYRAFSAGSQPKAAPHPMTLATLERLGHDTHGLRSKSWDEFTGPHSPEIDFVFTVCANAAGESCPVWSGGPITTHWGVEDPAAFEGSASETATVFEQIYHALRVKIEAFVELDPEEHSRLALQQILREIGAG